ncbi:MAG: GNAT family N-acetyltransferase [Chitinophagaceae bacterium]
MLIQHKQIGDKGMFYVGQDGAILAELVYNKPAEDSMIIEHTEVDDALSGKGVGLQLVTTAIDYARTQKMKITPLCSYARAVFKKHPEYSDVLA